jgi:hypothetical protein
MSEIVKIICCDTLAITFTVAFCLAAVLCAVCAIVFVIQWIREEKGDRDYLNLICLLNDKNIAELERRAKKMMEEYDINESEDTDES